MRMSSWISLWISLWVGAAVVASSAHAWAAADRIALLQLDAALADAHNEAVVVREAADRVARATSPDTEPSFGALAAAMTRLTREIATVQKQGAPVKFDRVVAAAADVERDWRTLRAAASAHDAHAIREDGAHLLQALGRIEPALDAVFREAGFQRLQFVGAWDSASR